MIRSRNHADTEDQQKGSTVSDNGQAPARGYTAELEGEDGSATGGKDTE